MRKDPIHICPYTLHSKKPLNAISTKTEHHGVLVRQAGGYGCLHPWEELGDQPLERQLKVWRLAGWTKQTERVEVCCRHDSWARKAGRSAFTDYEIPVSHSQVAGEIMKVKCGPDIKKEAERLKTIPAKVLRLDFNACIDMDTFLKFVDLLDAATLKKIDFVEDPFPGDKEGWEKVQKRVLFDLAADREMVRARVRIMKPALEGIKDSPERVVFTSYMDHPVGQYFAAREAAAYYLAHPHQVDVCGFLTHELFENDPFIERMQVADGRLVPQAGTGWGFDDLLEALPWQPL